MSDKRNYLVIAYTVIVIIFMLIAANSLVFSSGNHERLHLVGMFICGAMTAIYIRAAKRS